MDYDLTDIPAAYDRGRELGPEVLKLWMNEIRARLEGQMISRILDLGCGTGRFSECLSGHFNADVLGIDPSTKMLRQAREKRRIRRVYYQRGYAEAVPLRSQSVDMIFMSMSFHHFSDPNRAARECRRVLVGHGHVCVRTGTRERIPSYPYVPFFPSTPSMLERLLPDRAGLREVFESAGFHMVSAECVTQTVAQDWEAYAEKLAAGGDSVLARLSRQDFESGLDALRSHGARQPPQPVVEPIDLFVFR